MLLLFKMSYSHNSQDSSVSAKNWLYVAGAIVLTFPALYLKITSVHTDPQVGAIVFGLAIVGAAFLVTWAAESAQARTSQALVLALVALIAILPEYAVDLYFAWTAGKDPSYAAYAAANMTGANRLLIGIGWSMVLFLFCMKGGGRTLQIHKAQTTELSFLVIATLYSFTIPIKGHLSLVDTLVLVTLFGLYMWRSSRGRVEEVELVGPSAAIDALPESRRRVITILFFLFPAFVILMSAEPFAEGLIQTGKSLNIDEFILIQWIAPLASEAPELLIAALFVLRHNATAGMGILISSKVNQWTLLVGTLPLAYSISSGGLGALPLDARQVEEVLLTSAQSVFAIVILAHLRFSLRDASALFLLFATQLIFTDPRVRYGYSALYLALALFMLLKDRERVRRLYRIVRDTASGLRSSDNE